VPGEQRSVGDVRPDTPPRPSPVDRVGGMTVLCALRRGPARVRGPAQGGPGRAAGGWTIRPYRWILVLLVLSLPAGFQGLAGAVTPSASARSSGHPRAASEEWLAVVRGSIGTLEYEATWQRAKGTERFLQAPNRANDLRTSFTPGGVRVVPRADPESTWEWGLSLSRYGLEGNLIEVGKSDPVALGNRVEYRRGSLREWYVNDQQGLEQGFTLYRPPPGTGNLILEMSPRGSLIASWDEREGVIEFDRPSGTPVLGYGDLFARDAIGRWLGATLSLARSPSGSDLLRITVDAAGAVYPVTIDPLVKTSPWIAESDQAFALFGNSVAGAGDVNGDGYDDVIVGAYWYDNGQTDEGRAFVYYGSAGGLSTTPDWIAESDQASALFGNSVAGAGDVNGDGYDDVIVGAPNHSNGQAFEGRAYVYHGSAAGLSTTADWTAESDRALAFFGISVAGAGDVNGDGYDDVIVGADDYSNGQTFEGRAFAYHGSAGGLSTTADWTAESNQVAASFGYSVSGAGDVNGDGYDDVIVGAFQYDFGRGRAFAYHGSAGGLSTIANWTAEPGRPVAYFGYSVARAGDVNGDGYDDVIVGAIYFDNGQSDEGRAFAYHGSAAGLSTTANWIAESNQAHSHFGISVAGAGDVNGDGYDDVIVGAPWYDNGQLEEGRAFAYYGSAAGLSTSANRTAESNQVAAYLGVSVAGAGDVDGDGYDDVIVGVSFYDHGQEGEGRAYVYPGQPGV
jgi:hypothetical protein